MPPEPPAATVAATADDLAGDGITIANLNILHGSIWGADCDLTSDNCDAPGRVEIAARHIEASGCPDVVTLQEVDLRVRDLLAAALDGLCEGVYTLSVYTVPSVSINVDMEGILTKLPVIDEYLLDLPAFPWSAHHVALDSGLGRVDLVTTHLASSAMNPPCLPGLCPPYCPPLSEDVKTCGARQILHYLGTSVPPDSVHIVTGDFNAEPGHIVYELFTAETFFADTHRLAGNPECSPGAAPGCTSGGRGEPDGLYDPAALSSEERIDYIMVRGHAGCAVVVDTAADLDTDAVGTGTWADLPADPPGSGGLGWASDHSGNQADIHCTAATP